MIGKLTLDIFEFENQDRRVRIVSRLKIKQKFKNSAHLSEITDSKAVNQNSTKYNF